MASTDLYALLKVDKDVQAPQLKKAYYALARKVHPDKRPGDEQAKADFLARPGAPPPLRPHGLRRGRRRLRGGL